MKIYATIPRRAVLANSVFVYPTETCYGLGCNALCRTLVQRIYAIKDRLLAKPLSWIVADQKMAEEFVEFSEKTRELVDRFWPGGLTLVLPLKKKYARTLGSAADCCIGVRVSSFPLAREISRVLKAPIVATSANLSGNAECYSVEEAAAQFALGSLEPDFAIDCGVLPHTPPTTIARATGNKIDILRQGEVYIK